MKSDRVYPVAIVGGGFSGTILAAQLARRGIASVLIDGSGRLGKGVAYSTTEQAHLLNVPAEVMSAWPDKPEDFAQCYEAEGGNRRGYAERRLFGRYLDGILGEAIASGRTKPVHGNAVGASHHNGSWKVELENSRAIEARALILAVGNQEPEPLSAFARAGNRFVGNPWQKATQAAVRELAATGQNALIVGTGLTMIDLVLSLDAAGHQGKIVAVSRRGLIPRSHADFASAPVEGGNLPRGNLRALLRWLRRRSAEVGWRAAVDSLRPHTQALWEGLGSDQQRRFLRHGRPWWDVHRSRIAPEVADTIARLIGEGRLEVMAGCIISACENADGLQVSIRRRNTTLGQTTCFAYAFNCTGPLHSITRTKDPLLRSLLDAGVIRPDPLGIGVDVDQRSRAAGGKRVWALGPLTKGCYWEIIAVPDIRVQAAEVAEDIARELR